MVALRERRSQAENRVSNVKVRPPLSAVGKKHRRFACVKGVKRVGVNQNLGGTAENF